MRVCFLLPALERSGGATVAVGHALRLAERAGASVDLVLTGPGGGEANLPVEARTIAEARLERYDVAIATWWETASLLWELEADRHICFLQSFEQRFYGQEELVEQLGAEAVLSLPVDFVVVAGWMCELLQKLRPDASAVHVPNGVDSATFGASRSPRASGPLRVLIEGQPSLWFKGVDEGVRAVRSMGEPVQLTLLSLDPAEADRVDADRVVGDLEPAQVAKLYGETDVLLKLSRVESLGLPPLEAMHAGVPSVVTPFTGHGEYLEHGENGLVVGFDDLPGTTRTLDLLARDRPLLKRLSAGARATAAAWPSLGQAEDAFAAALDQILGAPRPAPDLRLLQRTLAFHREVGRDQAADLRHTKAALASAIAAGIAQSDQLTAMLDERSAELVALKSTRSYRLHRASARLTRLVRR